MDSTPLEVEISTPIVPRAVELVESPGEWFVRVVEDGREHVASFETQAFAESYSEGQRLRLGLETVARI